MQRLAMRAVAAVQEARVVELFVAGVQRWLYGSLTEAQEPVVLQQFQGAMADHETLAHRVRSTCGGDRQVGAEGFQRSLACRRDQGDQQHKSTDQQGCKAQCTLPFRV